MEEFAQKVINEQDSCSIHYHNSSKDENVTEIRDIASWKTILKAVEIRKYKPLPAVASNITDGKFLKVKYHRNCRSLFTLKRQ